jgi:hypothetical protein
MPWGAPVLPGNPPRNAFRMGGVMQRLRETLVFMRVGVPVVRYLATFEGVKSRQKAVFFPLFCGFYGFFFCFCPDLQDLVPSCPVILPKTYGCPTLARSCFCG